MELLHKSSPCRVCGTMTRIPHSWTLSLTCALLFIISFGSESGVSSTLLRTKLVLVECHILLTITTSICEVENACLRGITFSGVVLEWQL